MGPESCGCTAYIQKVNPINQNSDPGKNRCLYSRNRFVPKNASLVL